MKKGNVYYERVKIDGMDTIRKIPVSTLAEAKQYRAARLIKHAQAKEGVVEGVESPYEKPKRQVKADVSFDELCQAFLDAGLPDKKGKFKEGVQLSGEKRRVEWLRSWPGWKERDLHATNNATLYAYSLWRKSQPNQIKNGRVIDAEVHTLKNILGFAELAELIPTNPLSGQVRKFKGKSVSAKECCCLSADELHCIAETFFDSPHSEVLGFQMLFEAFTGVRTSEALACRWDAKYMEAGHIDGDHIHLARRKAGVNPWAQIHPALAELLKVMKLWRSQRVFVGHEHKAQMRYADSPWFFPSPFNPMQPVGKQSLAHSLRKRVEGLINAGDLPTGARRTSHGCRAFYVMVRRSEFVSDGQIAAEIGDVSGAPIIIKHYGPLPPNWMDSKEGKITWLPKGKPAWDKVAENLKASGKIVSYDAA